MRISAKVDYAVRAAVQLAAAEEGRPTKGDAIARAQGIPLKFLENILSDLRHAGLVRSQRGADGGYWLNRSASEITVAAEPLSKVWIAVRASLRSVAEHVTLADIAGDALPEHVATLASDPEAWVTR
jgi:DNA-binding IscR family transcriptional regulator